MQRNQQLDRLVELIKRAEKGLEGGIKTLQANIKALIGGGIVPPKPKKDLIKALEQLRKALDRAIRALEKKIAGKKGAPKRKKSKKTSKPG